MVPNRAKHHSNNFVCNKWLNVAVVTKIVVRQVRDCSWEKALFNLNVNLQLEDEVGEFHNVAAFSIKDNPFYC